MSGISEALVATGVGLLVALPAVIAFNWFQRIIRSRTVATETLIASLLGHLKSRSSSARAHRPREGGVAVAQSRSQADDDAMQGINVTPLVNIMLVLVIIFMVASQVGKVLDLELQLPRAASAESAPPPTLTIEVGVAGELRLDGRTVTPAELQASVRRAATASPDAQR